MQNDCRPNTEFGEIRHGAVDSRHGYEEWPHNQREIETRKGEDRAR